MIVDSSALVAVLLDEPEGPAIRELLARAETRIAAPTLVEVRTVMISRHGADGARRLETLLRQVSIEVIPFTKELADIATDAYRAYGRGSGHGAQLNFGDTFSYAVAYANNEPLLFVGDDFSRTDIRSALEESA